MMWGSHYIEMFKRSCFRSINWPLNREVVKDHIWNIYTKKEHFEELDALFKDQPFKLQLWEIGESIRVAGVGYVPFRQCDAGVVLLNGLRDQIHWSITNQSKMLFCPPDSLFGDGSIPNLISIGSDPYTCVFSVHPRVLPSIVDDIDYLGATRGSISNASLVTLAFKHQHAAWEYAEVGHKNNNSLIGGISWKKLSSGLYSVQHRLPTPYFLGFTESDYSYWWGQVSFGCLDHRFPGENLIRQERQRIVGSSDACFVVEITDHDKNVPPIAEGVKTKDPDAYWGDCLHHSVNRLFSVILRGE